MSRAAEEFRAAVQAALDPSLRELSRHAQNVLYFNGLVTPELIRKRSDADLLRLPNLGRGALREIRKAVGQLSPRSEMRALMMDARRTIRRLTEAIETLGVDDEDLT